MRLMDCWQLLLPFPLTLQLNSFGKYLYQQSNANEEAFRILFWGLREETSCVLGAGHDELETELAMLLRQLPHLNRTHPMLRLCEISP
jgi:hypothetical protein